MCVWPLLGLGHCEWAVNSNFFPTTDLPLRANEGLTRSRSHLWMPVKCGPECTIVKRRERGRQTRGATIYLMSRSWTWQLRPDLAFVPSLALKWRTEVAHFRTAKGHSQQVRGAGSKEIGRERYNNPPRQAADQMWLRTWNAAAVAATFKHRRRWHLNALSVYVCICVSVCARAFVFLKIDWNKMRQFAKRTTKCSLSSQLHSRVN